MLTEDHIRTTLLDILAKIAPEVDVRQLDPAKPLRNQFDFDSVDFTNFAVAIQERLKVEIPEQDYPQLSTLQGCIAFLKSSKVISHP